MPAIGNNFNAYSAYQAPQAAPADDTPPSVAEKAEPAHKGRDLEDKFSKNLWNAFYLAHSAINPFAR